MTSTCVQTKKSAWLESGFLYQGITIAFTLWMLFWIPVVLWAYGPINFLWLCNISKFLYLYALWTRNRLLASSQAGILLIVGTIWTLDFAVGVLTGGQAAVMSHYMWLEEIPRIARASSLYHLFLAPLAVWMVYTLGYDRRGPWIQTGIGSAALILTALITPEYRNINWIYAPFNIEQVWLPHGLYVALTLVAYPVLLYWPGHALVLGLLRVLKRNEPEPARAPADSARSLKSD